jgi:uncharacterized Tic20 family protein
MSESNPYQSGWNLTPDNEKLVASLVHALAIPFEFFAPLIGYLVFKDKGPFVAHHTKESLNFALSMVLLAVVLCVSIVGIFLLWVVPILITVFRIVAAVKASQGEFWQYPLTIRFIK